jgi:2-dehydropantoate 2-reductase
MKVAVVGAGAIGAYVGACLARGGTETHLVARGEHLEAMRAGGVRVVSGAGDFQVDLHATDDPREIGTVDVVFLGLKAYSYAGAGPLLEPLLGPETPVIAAQNGIPWWYFYGHGGPYDGRRLESVDPGGAVTATIATERAIGCVVYPAAELAAPGVVRHIEGNRLSIGEPDRSDSERCRRVCGAMSAGGLKCRVTRDLRAEIWVKLLGNATFNPLSALTRATMADLCAFPPTRELLAEMMGEVAAVADAVGYPPRISVERRLEGAEGVGNHKTSMLQDLEAGKRLELEVLVGAVLEIGGIVGVELPRLGAVHAAAALLDPGRASTLH